MHMHALMRDFGITSEAFQPFSLDEGHIISITIFESITETLITLTTVNIIMKTGGQAILYLQ